MCNFSQKSCAQPVPVLTFQVEGGIFPKINQDSGLTWSVECADGRVSTDQMNNWTDENQAWYTQRMDFFGSRPRLQEQKANHADIPLYSGTVKTHKNT